jgi:hypothetical protein
MWTLQTKIEKLEEEASAISLSSSHHRIVELEQKVREEKMKYEALSVNSNAMISRF